jgi:hypothetical protein
MCKPHWTEYTRALRQAAKARKSTGTEGEALTGAVDTAIAREVKRMRKAPKVDPNVAEAEALIAEVDALPGPEAVKRNGDPDVQAALETVAAANGGAREMPLGDAISGGTEEADAA